MKSIVFVLVAIFLCLHLQADLSKELSTKIDSSDKADAKVKAFVKKALIPQHINTVFAAEVEKHNAKKLTLEHIIKVDKEWQAAEDFLPIQEELTENATAEEVRNIIKKHPAIKEAFVMGNQGAVVGENDLTSDYWQGDEAKWKNSFNSGKGGIDVGKVKLDKSTNSHLQQISMPIVKDGKVIGAITFGIDVSKI